MKTDYHKWLRQWRKRTRSPDPSHPWYVGFDGVPVKDPRRPYKESTRPGRSDAVYNGRYKVDR